MYSYEALSCSFKWFFAISNIRLPADDLLQFCVIMIYDIEMYDQFKVCS